MVSLPQLFFPGNSINYTCKIGAVCNPYSDIIVNIAVIIAVGSTLFAFFMYTIEFGRLTMKSK